MNAAAGHPPDGVLIAFLDRALSRSAAEAVAAHLDGCADCRARREALEDRQVAVRSWLGRHDPTPPPRAAYRLDRTLPGRSGLRWAAAALIVLGTGALVGPLRGWVLDRLGAGSDDASLPSRSPAPDAGDAEAATGFLPRGPVLEIRFESPATSGRLFLEPTTDSLVTVRSPVAALGLAVAPGRVRILNEDAPGADVRLAVPPTLERVVLRVSGAPARTIPVRPLNGIRVVDLGG